MKFACLSSLLWLSLTALHPIYLETSICYLLQLAMEILFNCFSLIPINRLLSPIPPFPFPRKFWSISSKIRYVYPVKNWGNAVVSQGWLDWDSRRFLVKCMTRWGFICWEEQKFHRENSLVNYSSLGISCCFPFKNIFRQKGRMTYLVSYFKSQILVLRAIFFFHISKWKIVATSKVTGDCMKWMEYISNDALHHFFSLGASSCSHLLPSLHCLTLVWGPFPQRLFLNFIAHWWSIHFITSPKCPTDTSAPYI